MRLNLVIMALVACNAQAADVVKMSKNNICHDEYSSSYNRIKKFTAYKSLQECLNSGGRLPKNQQKKKAPLKPKAFQTYSRSAFGQGWADNDYDCQNTRAEILIQQSVGLVSYKSEDHCRVVKGKWHSLFSGKDIYDASKVDIDHIVPLKWAWMHGADRWERKKRIQIANDPANLVSVEASLNRQKGAKGPDEWLPPKNRCQYLTRFQRIVKKYQIRLADTESESFQRLTTRYCEVN